MTVYERYQELVKEENQRHQNALDELRKDLEIQQEDCIHEWNPIEKAMFYALGETAPGKQCSKCGVKYHLTQKEANKYWNQN